MDVQDVRIVAADDVILAGDLWMPRGQESAPPYAAIVLVGGTGAQDRNGGRSDLPGYEPFTQIAERATEEGVAVLRLDDRGVGESGGAFAGTTTSRAASDVLAAVQWLRRRAEIDSTRVGIVGHSEGGLIALVAAASDTGIRSLVLLATAARTGREVSRWQRRFVALRDSSLYPPGSHEQLLRDAELAAEHQAQIDPWLHEWFSLDPLTFASRIRGRVLVIHGESDRQVPVEQASELASVLGHSDVSVVVKRFPRVDHLLLEDADGDPQGYTLLASRRIPRVILETIAMWVSQRS